MFDAAIATPLPLRHNAALRFAPPMHAADEPLATLYPQLRRGLLAYLRKLTGDRAVAEDLLHDVVLKALAAGRDAELAVRNPVGWMYTVARNAAMDHHRRSRPSDPLNEDLAAEPSEAYGAATLDGLTACLRPAAQALPETYRATVIAAELEGRPLAEIAAELGLSVAAVKQRASRGRRLLRDQLVECCRVALSPTGTVLDHDAARRSSDCAPRCGSRKPLRCR